MDGGQSDQTASAGRQGRAAGPASLVDAGGPWRRVLVVADERLTGHALEDAIVARARASRVEVFLVVPAGSRWRTWLRRGRESWDAAHARLDAVLLTLTEHRVVADGIVSCASRTSAVEAALRTFAADEVLTSSGIRSRERHAGRPAASAPQSSRRPW